MLNNPAAILHQNLTVAMKTMPEETPINKNTLMGPPKKQMTKAKDDDILSPSRRAASYIEMLRKKREEIMNA
tara:strand:+ start:2158 stop:2373 length:216 start_codon:yes stop_codon:yes gene_type:complete